MNNESSVHQLNKWLGHYSDVARSSMRQNEKELSGTLEDPSYRELRLLEEVEITDNPLY